MRKRFSNLVPAGDTFVENNGNQLKLLKFVGTIPIVYKGQTYHIPVSVWLPQAYPYQVSANFGGSFFFSLLFSLFLATQCICNAHSGYGD
jgi:hypothetical protein